MIALGLVLNLAVHLAFDTADYRIPGVLQRIGVCVIVVGAISMYCGMRTRWVILGALLAGYAALLAAGGTLAPELNLASRIDAAVFAEHGYVYDARTMRGHDPEGLLSTLGALATTLLGLIAGELLRERALRRVAALAVACVLLGGAWSFVLPLNKNLWTPSYALWSAGWAALVLLALHVLIDRRGWPALGRSLGMNAIVVYAGSILLVCALAALGWNEPLYRWLFASWLAPLFGNEAASLAHGVAHVTLWWVIAWLLHRRGLHFRL